MNAIRHKQTQLQAFLRRHRRAYDAAHNRKLYITNVILAERPLWYVYRKEEQSFVIPTDAELASKLRDKMRTVLVEKDETMTSGVDRTMTDDEATVLRDGVMQWTTSGTKAIQVGNCYSFSLVRVFGCFYFVYYRPPVAYRCCKPGRAHLSSHSGQVPGRNSGTSTS